MWKNNECFIVMCDYVDCGQAFPKDGGNSTASVSCIPTHRRKSYCSLYVHGRVSCNVYCLNTFGEVHSHVAPVSCLIRVSQLCSNSGAAAYMSLKCSWLPAANDVSFAILSVK